MCDHRRIPKALASLMGQAFFDTGNDLNLPAASFTGFDVDKVN
jgi:hypothetical protein